MVGIGGAARPKSFRFMITFEGHNHSGVLAYTDQGNFMISSIKRAIPLRFKQKCLMALQSLDRRRMSLDEFRALLQRHGFQPGATVMVHSSLDKILRRVPELTPLSLIALMQELLGEDGMLMMPTFPFGGKQIDYVESSTVFNVARTPSKVGLLTELFRRMPGVVRSMHPTHPVAVWGRDAASVVEHHCDGSAFGPGSPFGKLDDLGGMVVALGCPLSALTLLHVPEERHAETRESLYTEHSYPMTVVSGSKEITVATPAIRREVVLDYSLVIQTFQSEQILNVETLSGLTIGSSRASDFIKRGVELLEKGLFYPVSPDKG